MKTRTATALLAALVIGWMVGASPIASAEHRGAPQPQAFTSGAMRSENILREIAATLRGIDARLARLEAIAAASATGNGRGHVR